MDATRYDQGTLRSKYSSPRFDHLNNVRPTSGIEFVSSSHFPDDVQGDILINNNIGFLGAKQHKVIDQDPVHY